MTYQLKTLIRSAALGLAVVSVPAMLSTPAAAQSREKIAVANYEAAVRQTNAFQTAVEQMKTTYKADIDASEARATSLQAELKPLVDAYNAAVQQPNATPQTVQPQAQALDAARQRGQQELGRLQQRITLATAYVNEQIALKLNDAIRSVMKSQKVDLVLQPQAVIAREPYVDITAAIVAELNRTVPNASITPPAGWQPGQAQQAQAAQPAQQPTGR